MKERQSYPSDISREQFEVIRPTLENFRRRTKPTTIDRYDIYCAILYSLKTGCQWSALPHDYPAHHTVYTYFRQWAAKPFEDQPSLLEKLLQEQVAAARVADESIGHQAPYCSRHQRAASCNRCDHGKCHRSKRWAVSFDLSI